MPVRLLTIAFTLLLFTACTRDPASLAVEASRMPTLAVIPSRTPLPQPSMPPTIQSIVEVGTTQPEQPPRTLLAPGLKSTDVPVPLPTNTAFVPLLETATSIFRTYAAPNPEIIELQTALASSANATPGADPMATLQAQRAARIVIANILYDRMRIDDPQRLWGGGDIQRLDLAGEGRWWQIAYGYIMLNSHSLSAIRPQAIEGLANAVCDMRLAGFTTYTLAVRIGFYVQDSDERDSISFRITPVQIEQLNCDSPLLNRIWSTGR